MTSHRRVLAARFRMPLLGAAVAILACGREGATLPSGLPEASLGLVTFNDQPWNALAENGWGYLRRTASKDSDIVSDPTAPVSPPRALRIIFTTDMAADSEPGVHWIRLPAVREVYAGWAVRWSPNWACSPAGCGKIAFLHTEAEGTVYINYGDFGLTSNPKSISVNTLWAPYGQHVWPANRALTTITPGTWYWIEWYNRYSSSAAAGDGVMRWWVNGVLNGEYDDVRFPSGGFVQFEFAPTRQNPPPVEQYMYVDHTRLRIR